MNKFFVTTILASSLLLFTGSIAGAQTGRARIADTPIREEANLASAIIATVTEGGAVDVVDLQGDWFRVVVPNEQGKPRTGYVLARLIEFVNSDGSPMLVPTGGAARPVVQGPRIPPTIGQIRQLHEREQALAALALERDRAMEREQALKAEVDALQAEGRAVQDGQQLRQTNFPAPVRPGAPPTIPSAFASARFKKVWLDVNFGMAMSAADASLFSFSALVDTAAYYGKPPRGAEFDFGGGFMFTPVIGLGASFSGAAHKDIVGLGAAIGNVTLASGYTDELVRAEGAMNVQAMIVLPLNQERFRARVFGGPSFFTYKADMVSDFSFARSQVTSVRFVNTEGSALGLHFGGDATFFFSKVVGIGGFARYSRATATIDEPMSLKKQKITLGGLQTGGGLRFRF
jgi:hypothetical protein